MPELNYAYDALLQLKDAGAISADAAAQIGGVDKILTVGDEAIEGEFVVDLSAIDTTTGDEMAHILLQGSNSPTFASGIVNLALVSLGGATTQLGGKGATSTLGRYSVPFKNIFGGVKYAYLRAYTDVGGTTPSINYVASLSLRKV